MVKIIVGKRGKGKTKCLLNMVNEQVKIAHGSLAFLDKSAKHMYELNNKVRLINIAEYPVESFEGFIGFVCGVLSQDNDLEQIYVDCFMKIAGLEGTNPSTAILQVDQLSKKLGVDFVLSVSADKEDLDEEVQSYVIVSL
ncbi:MAG: twitching motility protein PilT [Lachnospiraceae bacterium]